MRSRTVLVALGTALLVLSAVAGQHNAPEGADLDTLAGTIGNHNGVRCPWACNCGGQELDCASRGLTQVPANLAALSPAEKL